MYFVLIAPRNIIAKPIRSPSLACLEFPFFQFIGLIYFGEAVSFASAPFVVGLCWVIEISEADFGSKVSLGRLRGVAFRPVKL